MRNPFRCECAGASAVYVICLVYLKFIQPQLPQSAHMSMESELSDIDEDSIGAAYLQVATVANSTLKCDPQVEDTFTLVSASVPDTPALWLKVKECEPREVFLWCDFDSLDLIIF